MRVWTLRSTPAGEERKGAPFPRQWIRVTAEGEYMHNREYSGRTADKLHLMNPCYHLMDGWVVWRLREIEWSLLLVLLLFWAESNGRITVDARWRRRDGPYRSTACVSRTPGPYPVFNAQYSYIFAAEFCYSQSPIAWAWNFDEVYSEFWTAVN